MSAWTDYAKSDPGQLEYARNEIESLQAQVSALREALSASPCSCTCLTHESDWSQNSRFSSLCLFIKRLRQSGEPMEGPGEQPCEKKICTRCTVLATPDPGADLLSKANRAEALEAKLTLLANMVEEAPKHEITIARRRDGRVYVAAFDSEPCYSGIDLEEALEAK